MTSNDLDDILQRLEAVEGWIKQHSQMGGYNPMIGPTPYPSRKFKLDPRLEQAIEELKRANQ